MPLPLHVFCGTGAMSAMLGKDSYRRSRLTHRLSASDHDVNFPSITDDLFISKHPVRSNPPLAFANAVLRRGISVNFMVDTQPVVDLTLFKHLHRAACAGIHRWETGSYEQLRAYRKQILTVDKMPTQSTPCARHWTLPGHHYFTHRAARRATQTIVGNIRSACLMRAGRLIRERAVVPSVLDAGLSHR